MDMGTVQQFCIFIDRIERALCRYCSLGGDGLCQSTACLENMTTCATSRTCDRLDGEWMHIMNCYKRRARFNMHAHSPIELKGLYAGIAIFWTEYRMHLPDFKYTVEATEVTGEV